MSSGCISWPPSKRWHLQKCLPVGLAMGILSLGGQTASAQSGRSQIEPGWSFCIQVYDSARVPPGTLATAFSVAGHVLLAAGVPTEWHAGSTGAENREGRSCLILSVTRGVSRNVYPGALGFALPNTQTGADVTIFYDRIELLEMWPVSRGASVSQILGYAMAHEIGHVLLGSREHSAEGIMTSPWKEAEFERLSKGWFGFTPHQGVAMRERAFRQATLQQSARTKSKTEASASHLDVGTSSSGKPPHS